MGYLCNEERFRNDSTSGSVNEASNCSRRSERHGTSQRQLDMGMVVVAKLW